MVWRYILGNGDSGIISATNDDAAWNLAVAIARAHQQILIAIQLREGAA